MAVPKNAELSRANKRPGVYVSLQLNAAGSGDDSEQFTVLLFGERLSTGIVPPDTVYDVVSEQDVIDGSGRASTIHRQYQAAVAQVGGGNVRIKACGVAEPSGGVASIYRVCVSGTATLAGSLRLAICGLEAAVGYAVGDTAATVIAALRAQVALLPNGSAPVTVGAVQAAAGADPAYFTLTYNVKGEIGEDLPIRVYNTESSGILCGPGNIVVTGNAAGGAPGSLRLICGTQTVTASVASGDTPQTMQTALKTAYVTLHATGPKLAAPSGA